MKGWDDEAAAWMKKRRLLYQEAKQAQAALEAREQIDMPHDDDTPDTATLFTQLLHKKREFKQWRRKVVSMMRKKKKEKEQSEFVAMEESKSDAKSFFRRLRKMKGASKHAELPARMHAPDGTTTTTDHETSNAWRNYFTALGNPPPTAAFDDKFCKRVEAAVMAADKAGAPPRVAGSVEMAEAVSEREVMAVIKAIKSGKAAGPDGIVGEFISKGGSKTHKALHALFAEVWRLGRVPDEWLLAHIVPIYKNSGTRKEMGNYRPIALMSVVAKMYKLHGSSVCAERDHGAA
jgi:hypothetical protein